MGKTKLFGRPTSKSSSHRNGYQEEKQNMDRLKTPSPNSKSSKQSSYYNSASAGSSSAAQQQHRYSEEKLGRRKHVEKAKQLAENKNSLRRRKKHEAARTMAQNLPRDFVKETTSNVSNKDLSESEAESIYESRKLLIRQIQGQIAKQVHQERESVSEYDSWSDLEDNFALAYEPIPLSIKMETWRKMSKREILRKVNSKKVRKDFEYLTHSEILQQIEKMQHNARYLSSKFGINHLMPHLDYGGNGHHDDHNEDLTETEVEQSEDDMSVASFVSGKEIYLSRAEILNKIHKVNPEKRSGGSRANKSPVNGSNKEASGRNSRESQVHRNGKLSPESRKQPSHHDSWSSRASSILKDPEAIYVSRVELLKKINVHEEPGRQGKSQGRQRNISGVQGKPAVASNKTRKSVTPPAPASGRERRQHDSWSSRASSILAAMEADQSETRTSRNVEEEPPYISRVELLKHLQLKSLEALSAASDKSPESDSDASTVKNEASNNKKNENNKKPGQTRKWLSQKLQFEKDMISVIRDNYASHDILVKNDNNNNIDTAADTAKPNDRQVNKKSDLAESRDDVEMAGGRNDKDHLTDWDSCSCVTCNTCQQSDCSCSDISDSSNASKSSHSSDGSVETIVDAQERVIKNSDIYIINGSDVSKASSKASSKSKMSKKSTNYDPLPLNGIDKIKQRKLTDEEIERERCQEKEENIRRMSTSEKTSRERKPKPKDVRGSVKSQGSWTNEEFAKLYEPVSADDLKKKKQMKDLRQHLKAWTPELGKTVEKINTVRRREVIRQLKAAVARNIDLDNLSEEELGKHLDIALSNLNLGGMYVPMEKNPSNSKVVSRENTDYDTFGSIDSLIFEPKLPTHEDIAEAQEEITQSFEYLENEDDGQMEMNAAPARHADPSGSNNILNIHEKVLKFEKPLIQLERRSPKQEKNALAVGQTTFAERVKLFQSLGGTNGNPSQDKQNVSHESTVLQTTQTHKREIETESEEASRVSRRRDSPMNDAVKHKRENTPSSQVTQTTWKEQALNKKSDRSGRESSASATSVSTNSSGSTVIYNVEVVESDPEDNVKKSTFKRRDSIAELKESVTSVQDDHLCSVCGEEKSIISELSCSCYSYEDCGCVTDDCSECGGSETIRRAMEEESKRKVPHEPTTISNQIPIVGNLRRINREAQLGQTMNIEKIQQKKGYIIEDEEDNVSKAPSVENGNKMPVKMKEKLNRNESFQKLQKRNQFRSISPDIKVEAEESKPSYENYKKSGLLVEVENGVPLIYKNEHNEVLSEGPESKCLDSPKGKGSEMGDSGISSDPASISPNSASSGSSDKSHPLNEKTTTNEVIKNLVPPGGKKRDTMIRELKTKLKERFPSNTLEDKNRGNGAKHTPASKPGTIRNPEVGPKLNKIFDALLTESGQSRNSPVTGLLRPHYRNGSFSQEHEDDEEDNDHDDAISETECESSVYDPSLPPGLENHVATTRSPPPAPPPTATGGKRGSIASSHTYHVNISPRITPSPTRSRQSPAQSEKSRMSPSEKREMLYGPGGVFGPTGPFSTPEISRYPEVAQPKRISFADMVDGKSDQSGFAEDRSDKSQYVSNHVIAAPSQSGSGGRRSSPTGSRVDNYHAPTGPSTKESSASAVKTSPSSSSQGQDVSDAWIQEKQKRMLNWINRSQVALGARIVGKSSS